LVGEMGSICCNEDEKRKTNNLERFREVENMETSRQIKGSTDVDLLKSHRLNDIFDLLVKNPIAEYTTLDSEAPSPGSRAKTQKERPSPKLLKQSTLNINTQILSERGGSPSLKKSKISRRSNSPGFVSARNSERTQSSSSINRNINEGKKVVRLVKMKTMIFEEEKNGSLSERKYSRNSNPAPKSSFAKYPMKRKHESAKDTYQCMKSIQEEN
jgi:hypothetical protein